MWMLKGFTEVELSIVLHINHIKMPERARDLTTNLNSGLLLLVCEKYPFPRVSSGASTDRCHSSMYPSTVADAESPAALNLKRSNSRNSVSDSHSNAPLRSRTSGVPS